MLSYYARIACSLLCTRHHFPRYALNTSLSCNVALCTANNSYATTIVNSPSPLSTAPPGEIFGGLEVGEDESDGEVLLQRLGQCTTPGRCPGGDDDGPILDLLATVRGPWAMAYWHHASRSLWFGRDAIGAPPPPNASAGLPPIFPPGFPRFLPVAEALEMGFRERRVQRLAPEVQDLAPTVQDLALGVQDLAPVVQVLDPGVQDLAPGVQRLAPEV